VKAESTDLHSHFWDRQPLDRRLAFETRDLAEVQRYISSVLCPHRLVYSNARVRFHHCGATMRRISFNCLNYGQLEQPIDMLAPNLAGAVTIHFTISGLCELRQMGQKLALRPGTIAVVNPDNPVRTRMYGKYVHLTLRVPRDTFHEALTSELGYAPTAPLIFRTDPLVLDEEFGGLTRLLRAVCEDLNSVVSPLSTGRASRHVEHSLLCLILSLIPHNYSAQLAGVDAKRLPNYLRRVIQYVSEHARDSIDLEDMVQVSGMSTRSLHLSFRRYINTTPMTYLRNCRLDMARDELQNAGVSGRSVTDVALDCGFSHLSKFASDFRRRFGVTPSQVRSGIVGESQTADCHNANG
jgi:AraC-like DNA-binding protein